jgi:hypothetical protein
MNLIEYNVNSTKNVDMAVAEMLDKYTESIIELSSDTLDLLDHYRKTPYNYCERGVFYSSVFSMNDKSMHLPFQPNQPPSDLVSVCWPDINQPCLRSQSKLSHFSSYAGCPAIHSYGNLSHDATRYAKGNNSIWVETGIIKVDNQWEWFQLSDDWSVPEKCVYPCLMCMAQALNDGFTYLAVVSNKDGIPKVTYHNILSHAKTLVLIQNNNL